MQNSHHMDSKIRVGSMLEIYRGGIEAIPKGQYGLLTYWVIVKSKHFL